MQTIKNEKFHFLLKEIILCVLNFLGNFKSQVININDLLTLDPL